MDASIVNLITVGLSIKISRSDGRVHAANVKAVHPMKGAISVEWLENTAVKGKELDIGELWNLNRELFEHLRSCSQDEIRQSRRNNTENRRHTSRIPAPTDPSAEACSSDIPVRRRSVVRQTCLLPMPVPQSCHTEEDAVSTGFPSGSAIPYQTGRKNGLAKPSPFLPQLSEVEREDLPSVSKSSSTSTARRKSLAVADAERKRSRREPAPAKNTELQPKRGRDADSNRPNWQFYKMIEEYRETLEMMPIPTSEPVDPQRICVCIRKRPLNKQELGKKEIDVVSVPGRGVLLFHEPKQKVDLTKYLDNQVFRFDYAFDATATNDVIYRFTAKPLIRTVFEGGMATCFAYGQTGSGKTHTMGGDFSGKNQNSSKGIYALAAQDIFALLSQKKYSSMSLDPCVSFFEIYNGKVFDLLNKKARLRVLEDSKQQMQVVGLREVPISCAEDVIKMVDVGSACRTSGQTFANSNSSRSHAVLQITLHHRKRLHGKFSLVDLAGNERGTDVSGNDRQTMVETAEINCSLLALKECIRSLGRNSEHIPFRMSKLTQVLRDSFIGENSKTCMIAMISPGMSSCDYTLNTLRYADRVKELNHTAGVNDVDADNKMEVSEDPSALTEESSNTIIEAVSHACEMEERVYEELQKGCDIMKMMEKPSYDRATGIGDIMDHINRLHESALALQSAIDQEKLGSTAL